MTLRFLLDMMAAGRIPSGSRLLYSVFMGLFWPSKLKTIYSAWLFRGINLNHRLSNRLKMPLFPQAGAFAEE
jgi:hypothetical protein